MTAFLPRARKCLLVWCFMTCEVYSCAIKSVKLVLPCSCWQIRKCEFCIKHHQTYVFVYLLITPNLNALLLAKILVNWHMRLYGETKLEFMAKTGFPGTVKCVDGTHIGIPEIKYLLWSPKLVYPSTKHIKCKNLKMISPFSEAYS